MTALRALLAGVIDYAGLYPPAGLDMEAAVRNYGSYRADDNAWMLGRFVVPVARLTELSDALQSRWGSDGSEEPEWRISAIAGADCERDIAAASAFNDVHRGQASIDSLEARLPTESAITAAAALAAQSSFALFAEVAADPDPAEAIAAVKRTGISAKIRTGGVTPDAFLPPETVVRFVRRCIDAGVRFKATAGLHHPMPGEYPMTYETGSPVAAMQGYLNVLLATGFMTQGMLDRDAVTLLGERSPTAFGITPSAISWGDFRITAIQLRRIRGDGAVSFGSCSFSEPVDELRALTLL